MKGKGNESFPVRVASSGDGKQHGEDVLFRQAKVLLPRQISHRFPQAKSFRILITPVARKPGTRGCGEATSRLAALASAA